MHLLAERRRRPVRVGAVKDSDTIGADEDEPFAERYKKPDVSDDLPAFSCAHRLANRCATKVVQHRHWNWHERSKFKIGREANWYGPEKILQDRSLVEGRSVPLRFGE